MIYRLPSVSARYTFKSRVSASYTFKSSVTDTVTITVTITPIELIIITDSMTYDLISYCNFKLHKK